MRCFNVFWDQEEKDALLMGFDRDEQIRLVF